MGKDSINGELINLEALSTRAGFNSAVRHINKTIEISESLRLNNLGDLLHERFDEDLSGERGAFLLRMLLIDKLGYKAASANLENVAADVPALSREFGKWKGVDLVAAYHHPDLGLLIANPKAAGELAQFGMLRKRELLVLYAGKGNLPADDSCQKAAELALALFQGRKAKVPPEFLKEKRPPATHSQNVTHSGVGKTAEKAVSQAPALSKSPLRMTPLYSVVVSNECFHNGNVEAWKCIIESYKTKYPGLKVYIYYEGERVLDINSLFKWGKVKHGRSIQFAVAGSGIKDLAKLRRYLVQGASPDFEPFLAASPGLVLKLFG